MVHGVGSCVTADPTLIRGSEHLRSGPSPSAAVSSLCHDPSVSEGCAWVGVRGCAVLRTGARHGAFTADVRRVRRKCAVARFHVSGFGIAVSHSEMRRSGVRRVSCGWLCDMRRGAFEVTRWWVLRVL